MRTIKNLIVAVMKDAWGFLLLNIVTYYLRSPKAVSSTLDLILFWRFPKRFESWIGFEDVPIMLSLNIIFTTMFFSFFISISLACASIFFHLMYPLLSKILSCFLLPFAIYMFYKYTDVTQYRMEFYLFGFIFSAYGIIKAIMFHEAYPYKISMSFFDKIFKQSTSFYLSVLTQWLMIFIDVLIIRSQELEPQDISQRIIMVMYIISFVYSASYSIRANLTMYYAQKALLSTEPPTLHDKIFIFFNARCFAVSKSISVFLSIVDLIYTTLFFDNAIKPSIFEHSRSATFECSMNRKSYIEYMFSPKPPVWKGELRRKMKMINLREDMLPSTIISWIVLYSTISFIQDGFIRSQESFVIIFSHFYIILEIFNTYAFIEIYRSSYGIEKHTPKSADSEDKEDDVSVDIEDGEDDVLTSKIEVQVNSGHDVL